MADEQPQQPKPETPDSEAYDQGFVAVEKRIELDETIKKTPGPRNNDAVRWPLTRH